MKKLVLNVVLYVACCSLAYTQMITTGKVTCLKDGAPLQGVSVVVKNGRSATQTDAGETLPYSLIQTGYMAQHGGKWRA